MLTQRPALKQSIKRSLRAMAVAALALTVACSSGDRTPGPAEVAPALSTTGGGEAPLPRFAYHRPPPPIEEDPAVSGAPPGPIGYNGGSMLLGTVNIYAIFYGNFPASTNDSPQAPGPGAQAWMHQVGYFVNRLSGSPYMAINSTYVYPGTGLGNLPSASNLNWASAFWDTSYSQGTSLTASSIRTLIGNWISSGSFPTDSNGIYLVFGGSDVTEADFPGGQLCANFCGWHTSASAQSSSINGADLKYAFIGDPEHCSQPRGCTVFNSGTPSGNWALDAIISETAHEIEEAITDPDVSAYYTLGTDSQGNSYKWENEDRCVYQYGATYTVTSQTTGAVGATANIRLQNTDYMIQENWVNVGSGYCDTVFEPTTEVFWGQDYGDQWSRVGDWDSGSYKGQCPLGEAITGLSRYATASNHQAHAVQCGSLTVGNSGTLFGCNERTFDPGDNRGADFNWDWDSGYFKAECSPGEFVQGVAQSTSGTLDGILCCAGVVSHSACDVQVFDSHNSSAYGRPDWDYGYYKGQCPKGQYVAGVSAFAGSPQGAPHAILCCSP